VRDSFGKVGDLLTNPANLASGGAVAAVSAASGGAGFIDRRAEALSTTDPLEKNSLDYYVALRSMAAQRRAALVAEGKAGGVVVDKDGVTSAPVPVPAAAVGAIQ
jgi:phospholipid-binding lipoprotein MlaA